jgi:hypothetical protein
MEKHREWLKQSDDELKGRTSDIEQGLLHVLPALTCTALVAEGTYLKALDLAWVVGVGHWELVVYVSHNDKVVALKAIGKCVADCFAIMEAVLDRCNRGDALPDKPTKDTVLPIHQFSYNKPSEDDDHPF